MNENTECYIIFNCFHFLLFQLKGKGGKTGDYSLPCQVGCQLPLEKERVENIHSHVAWSFFPESLPCHSPWPMAPWLWEYMHFRWPHMATSQGSPPLFLTGELFTDSQKGFSLFRIPQSPRFKHLYLMFSLLGLLRPRDCLVLIMRV